MIPATYSNFLVASTQASAALIGLLFVSVSIAPERVFGSQAEAGRKALALSAFSALANVFFISFGGLIPGLPFGAIVIAAAVLATAQTLALLPLVPSWRRERTLIRSLGLFALSAVIYGYEIAIGAQLISSPTHPGSLTALLELLLGAYALGLSRAWELLGAPYGRGPFSGLLELIQGRLGAPAGKHETKPPAAPAADESPKR